MSITTRIGAAPLVILLAGISLVILAFAFTTIGNQAKASADLKSKLNEANTQLVASGMSAVNVDSSVKGVSSFNPKKSKKFTQGRISFNYPSELVTQETDEDTFEFASQANLFGQTVIPPGQVLVKARLGLNLQLSTIADYANRSPYATDHKVSLAGGRQILTVTNKHGNLSWDQLVVAESPQGPYHVFTLVPSGTKANQILDQITSTLKISNEAN